MTENAQLALIGVLGAFLTGLLGVVTAYLNLLMTKARDATTASQKAASAAQSLQTSLNANTVITKQVHGIVNGERSALLAELAARNDELKNLVAENAALKAAKPQKGVS